MIPINNSDTAWLIVADYNQDNGKYHQELREDVLNPDVSQWDHEIENTYIGGSDDSVGDIAGGSQFVGCDAIRVGGTHNMLGNLGGNPHKGTLVGGNDPYKSKPYSR